MNTALITGASRGLGQALAEALASDGWSLIIDARNAEPLADVAADLRDRGAEVTAIAGDVADATHRHALVAAAGDHLDLLVNNASILGPSPQPPLARYPLDVLRQVYEVNVVGPLALIQEALPLLRRSAQGVIVNITSDASVEPYPGWGGYGSSKAALDQLTAILGVEEPDLRILAIDPGDMLTQLHQEAFPGEDISDRPEPVTVVPGLLELIRSARPSGRVRAA